jgi:hypothetical protein
MTSDRSRDDADYDGKPQELIELYGDLGRRIAARSASLDALSAVTAVAVEAVPGVSRASITHSTGESFKTLAPTDPIASAADELQYELNGGPCVDSIRAERPLLASDVANDPRWPEFGPLAASRFGVGGMLSTRLVIEADIRASLNLYSDTAHGYTATSKMMSVLLSAHAASAVNRVVGRDRDFDLQHALENTRRTAMAIGVLMGTLTLTKAQSFDLLRIVSQHSGQRMPNLVEAVIATGTIDVPGLDGT